MKKERIQYSFDVWLFIPDEDKLIMNNDDVIIDNRLSKLLDFFCQNPNIVFSRDELINEVWNGSILTDQVITQAIFELRKTLKSAERHSMGYIITVPKRGYKLDVEVRQNILIPSSVTTNTISVVDSTPRIGQHEPTAPPQPTEDSQKSTHLSNVAVNTEQSSRQVKQADLASSSIQSNTIASEHLTSQNDEENSAARSNGIAHSSSAPSTPTAPTPHNENEHSSEQGSNDNEQATATSAQAGTGAQKIQLKKTFRLVIIVSIVLAAGAFWWRSQSSDSSADSSLESSTSSSALVDSSQQGSGNQPSNATLSSDKTSNAQISEAHQAHESVHYLSLEPRYIYVRIDESLKTDAFKRGVIHKLMSYLTTYRDYRIVVDETLVPNSANVVSFKSEIDGDREYLDITYFNRISNFKHLGRDYLIDPSSLHTTMRVMLDDLLDSFNIDIQKSILKQQISELPKQPEALKLTLESLGLTFMTLDRTDTLKKIIAANELAPNNHFIISSRYMYELANIFLMKSTRKEELVEDLNDKFGKKLLSTKNSPTSYRMYEALAAYFLTQDDPVEAERYIRLIPRSEYNVMSMIILAKVKESQGNPAAAEEYYYEAILEAGYPVVLNVAQTMFFKSNISEIESKLGTNQ